MLAHDTTHYSSLTALIYILTTHMHPLISHRKRITFCLLNPYPGICSITTLAHAQSIAWHMLLLQYRNFKRLLLLSRVLYHMHTLLRQQRPPAVSGPEFFHRTVAAEADGRGCSEFFTGSVLMPHCTVIHHTHN